VFDCAAPTSSERRGSFNRFVTERAPCLHDRGRSKRQPVGLPARSRRTWPCALRLNRPTYRSPSSTTTGMVSRASPCPGAAPPRSPISSLWREIGMDNFVSRPSHRLICQPPWRERSGSEQPCCRRIVGRGPPSAPGREETVPTGFPLRERAPAGIPLLGAAFQPANITERRTPWTWLALPPRLAICRLLLALRQAKPCGLRGLLGKAGTPVRGWRPRRRPEPGC
jgi:hypothetical protein